MQKIDLFLSDNDRDIPRHKTLTRSPVIYVTAKHTALYHNQDILYNARPSYSLGDGPLVNGTKQYQYDPPISTERDSITGEYGPKFMAVQTECNKVCAKITMCQYSTVCLEQGKLKVRLLPCHSSQVHLFEFASF